MKAGSATHETKIGAQMARHGKDGNGDGDDDDGDEAKAGAGSKSSSG
jgi:hypothetical protein